MLPAGVPRDKSIRHFKDQIRRRTRRKAPVAGQLQASPTINLILMPEWRELQTGILKALAPHRDARLAVTTALAEMESHHAAGHA